MNATDETIDSPPPPEPPPSDQPRGRLTRSSDDKVLAGVAGGLGRYFGVDPVVFRIAFVVLALAGGAGLFLYAAGWLLLPVDTTGVSEADRLVPGKNRNAVLAILAVVAFFVLVDGFDDGWGGFPAGVVLIGVGAAVLLSRRDRSTADAMPAAPPVASGSLPPPSPRPAVSPKPPKPRSVLVPVTLSVLAIAGGVLTLLGVSLVTGLGVLLLIIGVALVVGAWRGRARWLIPIALVLSSALAAAAVIDDVPVDHGIGDRAYRPLTVEELRSPYRLGVGQLTLDLSDLQLDGRTATVVATTAVGEVRVIVPWDAQVVVEGRAGAGQVDLFDQSFDGREADGSVALPGQSGAGRLVLRAHVGIGHVEVDRAAA